MTASEQDIHTLHRYFIWSLNLRDQFYDVIDKQGEPPEVGGDDHARWLIKPFMYGSLWFSMLYVVVEGCQELSLNVSGLDPLLSSPHIELLKRMRNGSFHYQKNYFDPRFTDFYTDEIVQWAVALQGKLSDYFLSLDESLGESTE
jgi:hypothetical protein